jgi:hypothetical protein
MEGIKFLMREPVGQAFSLSVLVYGAVKSDRLEACPTVLVER